MSNSEDPKKIMEEHDLYLFLYEYQKITGEITEVLEASESPDFIIQKSKNVFGLELVQVVESPETRFSRFIFDGNDEIDVSDASDLIQNTIYKKEEKRKSPQWRYPNSTILVVQLRQIFAENILFYLDDAIFTELAETTGFVEIWLSDHSPEEPYNTVELLCIKPESWRGLYRHSKYGSKPYG